MSCMARLNRPASLNFCSVALSVAFLPTAAVWRRAEEASTAAQFFSVR